MSKKRKIVYVAMSADLIHPGHLNINKASNLVMQSSDLTDNAIQVIKEFP